MSPRLNWTAIKNALRLHSLRLVSSENTHYVVRRDCSALDLTFPRPEDLSYLGLAPRPYKPSRDRTSNLVTNIAHCARVLTPVRKQQ